MGAQLELPAADAERLLWRYLTEHPLHDLTVHCSYDGGVVPYWTAQILGPAQGRRARALISVACDTDRTKCLTTLLRVIGYLA